MNKLAELKDASVASLFLCAQVKHSTFLTFLLHLFLKNIIVFPSRAMAIENAFQLFSPRLAIVDEHLTSQLRKQSSNGAYCLACAHTSPDTQQNSLDDEISNVIDDFEIVTRFPNQKKCRLTSPNIVLHPCHTSLLSARNSRSVIAKVTKAGPSPGSI